MSLATDGLSRNNLRTAFDMMDTNNDGTLSMEEFVKGCTSMGFLLSDTEITAVFNLIDADGGGSLDFDEFSGFIEKSADTSSEYSEFRNRLKAIVGDVCRGALRSAFDMIDTNGDGDLQQSEFLDGCKLLKIELSDEELNAIFQCIDDDGSGEIDFDEFCAFLQPNSKNVQQQFGQFRQKLLKVLTSDAFYDYYYFHLPETILLQHFGGDYLSVDPSDSGALNGNGKAGGANALQFRTQLSEDGKQTYLQSAANSGYIAITDGGAAIGLSAEKTEECLFRIQRVSIGFYKLQSVSTPSCYIAANVKGQVIVGKGGPFSRLRAYRKGIRPPFSSPYIFALNNTVVIEHKFGLHLRVDSEASDALNANGGKGALAQFTAEPEDGGKLVKLKSTVTGKYVFLDDDESAPSGHRIDCSGTGDDMCKFKVHTAEGPNQVRLESIIHEGEFINVSEKGVQVGDGSKLALLTFYRGN